MICLSTLKKIRSLNKKYALRLLTAIAFFITSFNAHAQNVLVGLTSNGSVDGKGTAFSINTNGNNFSVIQGFVDWGNTANGSFFLNDDGYFYGMTHFGGTYNDGTIFKMSADGKVTMLKQFNYSVDGAYPDGELIKGADGYLYGITAAGGANGYGTIFKISVDGDFSVIKPLSYSTDGAGARGHLTLAKDGNFYGITCTGGSNGVGTIFKLTPAGVYSVIHNMVSVTEGGTSYASLTEGKDGNLYGTTYSGGTYGFGTIFKVTTSGTLTVLRHLNSTADGTYPQSDLIQAKDGNFYGTCYGGGQYGNGTIFKISSGGNYSVVKNFSVGVDGGYPYAGLMQNTDGNFYGITRAGGAKSGGTIYKLTTAGVYTVIHNIDYANEGTTSSSVLVKGADGSLYAMTSLGGVFNYGIIFKTTTAGAFTKIADFNGATLGNAPYSSFIKGNDSAYYCTTTAGGAYNYGTIVKICGGKATVLHSFNKSTDGGMPQGDLLLASNGNFYGMTSNGGANGLGTIFKITPGGSFTVIHNFNGTTDGSNPHGGLIQAKDGNLYGMTTAGGANNAGTIFKISLSGTFKLIKSFVFATDGGAPNGNLLQANDNNFYGITSNSGRVFKLTTAGVYTNIHTFNSSTDGYNSFGSLIQAADGNLYGTCSDGGQKSAGTIFQITLSGTFKVLRVLDATVDGRMPKGTLLQGADGLLYGTTSIGGTYNAGTIFKISATGTYTVLHHMNITTDGGNAYGSLIFAPVNNLVANAQTVNVNEDTTVKITLTGSGGSPLTYTVTENPKHGKLSGTAPKLTYKPYKNYNGKDQFSFTVSVGCMASAPSAVTINVKPMPDSPVLAPIGNQTATVNTLLTFTATATDPDKGQTLTFSLIGAPAGAKINASTGVFKWTPTTAGSYSFKVRVKDNDTPALYDEEKITVTVANAAAAVATTMNAEVVNATVFPNPVDDKFYVTLQKSVPQLSLRIVNVSGVVAYEKIYSVNAGQPLEVNAAQLQRGIYFVQLQAETFNQTLKFIKK